MSDNVAIGMAYRAFVERDFHAANDELAALRKAMQVVPDSATIAHAFFCSE
jgi:hypothetical protein